MKNVTLKSILGTTALAGSMFVTSANATSLFDFNFLGTAGEVRTELVAKSMGLDLACGDKAATEAKTKDGKCGEGKCGDKKADKKTKSAKEAKTKDAKCGEGKCGDKKTKK